MKKIKKIYEIREENGSLTLGFTSNKNLICNSADATIYVNKNLDPMEIMTELVESYNSDFNN